MRENPTVPAWHRAGDGSGGPGGLFRRAGRRQRGARFAAEVPAKLQADESQWHSSASTAPQHAGRPCRG